MIVIPMAGLSRRFQDAGYSEPKYRLSIGGRSLFAHAVDSFRAYFEQEPFVFVVRDGDGARSFVETECRHLGLANYRVAQVEHATRGQADSVAIGLAQTGVDDDVELTIFNIDTVRPGFHFPTEPEIADADGALEVFRGQGTHWSFVKPSAAGAFKVAETAEKRRISDLCSTGLYRFRFAGGFRAAFRAASNDVGTGELYVAPLYNRLIAAGKDVRYWIVDSTEVIFSGTPAEYEAFKRAHEAKD